MGLAKRRGDNVHADKLTGIDEAFVVHALLSLVDGAHGSLGAPAALLRLVQAVVDVGYIFNLDAEPYRMAAREELGGKVVRFFESSCGNGWRMSAGSVLSRELGGFIAT